MDEPMDLDLSADQELFVETTRRFLEATCPLVEVRRLHDAGGGFDPGYWRQGAELGWTATLVDEADGGGSVSGDGLLDLVLVAEEMGRLVSPGPLVPVNVVADAVSRRGSAEQRAAVLPGLVSGEEVATWAFAEESGSWDAAGIALAATESDVGWSLTGTKTFVQDAGVAGTVVVTARTGDGLTQFLVPTGTTGVRVTDLGSLDLTRRFGRVDFDGATVPASAVLGAVGDAGGDVERQLQVALALQNAETVGATTTVLDFTLEYAKDRVAFGRPIGSYQALKHRFADMRTWLEACHATATASAKAVQAGADDASELTSVAKAYIADRCPAIIQDCVQLHGGIGVTWEHDLHLYLRRVAQNAALYGSVGQHRERVAALIGM
ncbi:MAG: acyl-CoA dehydrogenase family protein [Acidimicrobiia bacterium]